MKPVLVNPHHVKKSKELDDNHPTKNDRKDPKVIAGLINEGRFSYPYLPEGVYAELRTASNLRLQAQEELVSDLNTKNEPVVGRNNYQRARPCKGDKLTPWLWIGGTKVLRTHAETYDDPVGHRRFATIEGGDCTRPCRAKFKTFYFVHPITTTSVLDIGKYP